MRVRTPADEFIRPEVLETWPLALVRLEFDYGVFQYEVRANPAPSESWRAQYVIGVALKEYRKNGDNMGNLTRVELEWR